MLTSNYSLALAHLDDGNAEEAANILSGVVSRFPRYAAAQIALARAMATLGKSDSAISEWCKAEALVYGSDTIKVGLRDATARLFTTHGLVATDLSATDETDATDSVLVAGSQDAMLTVELADASLAETEAPILFAEHNPAHESAAESESELDHRPDGMVTYGGSDPLNPAVETQAAWENGDLPSDPISSSQETSHSADDADLVQDMQANDPAYDHEAPEWHEKAAMTPSTDDANRDLPKWETSFTESGDGSGSEGDIDMDSSRNDVELDRLIDELQSARIIPRPDLDAVPEPNLSSDIDDVVSETLARIYATQKQFGEAARVYERLALENPNRADEFQGKAAEMRRNL